MDSRVEGIGATNDLLKAVKYFSNKDIDVLVIIRGGGSLESLQAFNNEMLVRKIAELKFPVICGIGHDKDVPLLSYVADKSVSTPTAVAQTLNKSWEQALERANLYEKTIILKYENCLKDTNYSLNNLSASLINFYQFIFERFDGYSKEIKNNISNMNQIIRHEKYKIKKIGELINAGFRSLKRRAEMELDNFEKVINQNNPERQLKLGYSIVTLREKVVRSITQVKRGDLLSSKFGDGSIESEVK
jgi:exodeoxyribonuclease VII large subunit